MKDSTS